MVSFFSTFLLFRTCRTDRKWRRTQWKKVWWVPLIIKLLLIFYFWKTVFRIHDILVWIRILIRVSMTTWLGYVFGSGSCYFRHWPLRRQQVRKKTQNSRNQGFSYYVCLMIEGFGSDAYIWLVDPDPGGSNTCESGRSGSEYCWKLNVFPGDRSGEDSGGGCRSNGSGQQWNNC